MKFVKLLLSLDSLRLIVISAVAITYLAMTNPNSSKKTEAVKEGTSSMANEESKSVRGVGAESISPGNVFALQPTKLEEK